jgi:hypothetical protein
MNVLVDDHAISHLLRKRTLPIADGAVLYTTNFWYYRLCHAFYKSIKVGRLSSPYADADASERRRLEDRLLAIDDVVNIVPLRELAPAMGRLSQHYVMSTLSLEALAAALHLQANVYGVAKSPGLEAALRLEGLEYVLYTA